MHILTWYIEHHTNFDYCLVKRTTSGGGPLALPGNVLTDRIVLSFFSTKISEKLNIIGRTLTLESRLSKKSFVGFNMARDLSSRDFVARLETREVNLWQV